jgi:hypothetical protein
MKFSRTLLAAAVVIGIGGVWSAPVAQHDIRALSMDAGLKRGSRSLLAGVRQLCDRVDLNPNGTLLVDIKVSSIPVPEARRRRSKRTASSTTNGGRDFRRRVHVGRHDPGGQGCQPNC